MRRWIRCDCTGEPPGELIASATAFAPRVVKAFSSGRAVLASVSPGRSGVESPIVPESRTTGTTALPPRRRLGSQGRTASRTLASSWRKCSDMLGSLARGVPCSVMGFSLRDPTRQDFAPRPAHCRCISGEHVGSGEDLGTSLPIFNHWNASC